MTVPAGLIYHCAACRLVIPADAPVPDGANCAFVVKNKLAWFNPKATIKGQHTMATAAWSLIHHQGLRDQHPESVEYFRKFRMEPRAHFQASAAYKALTPEQIEEQRKLRSGQEAWAYVTEEI